MYVRGKASHSRQHDYCLQIYGDFTSKGIKEIQKKIKKPPNKPQPAEGNASTRPQIGARMFSDLPAEVFQNVSRSFPNREHKRENIPARLGKHLLGKTNPSTGLVTNINILFRPLRPRKPILDYLCNLNR